MNRTFAAMKKGIGEIRYKGNKLFPLNLIPYTLYHIPCSLFPFALLLLLSFTSYSQIGQQEFMLVKSLEKYHYQPVQVNDEFSVHLYNDFVAQLDPYGEYFTEELLKELDEWKTKLDDEILNHSSAFVEKVTVLYKKRLVFADTLISELLSKPLDFSAKDSLTFFSSSPDSVNYPANEAELKKRWNKWLKYQTLEILFTPADENDQPFSKDLKKIVEKEPEAQAKVLVKNQRTIKRILEHSEGFDNYVATTFLNSIAFRFDPHSEFFSPFGKQNFQDEVSAEELSFGIEIDENDKGEVEIAHLVPGGSAWKSNQLHNGDVFLKIKHSGTIEVDLSYASAAEVEEIVRSIPANEIELTVRKANGQIKSVSLIKSKLRADENVVKSYLLSGEKKIGYISLPSFYTEWDTTKNPLGCANDVAKEIVKLVGQNSYGEKEDIDGLILDLRYNGGGSVQEAIGLAGLFIDEGPLCIYKSRNEKPLLMKDINRGTAYNGPLIIMVNGLSASASEIFAAAVQNYHRAVIAGSSTFGKATGQIIIPLDTTLSLQEILQGAYPKKDNKLGFLKVTMEKYYHITDATHQKKGVIPDVLLPDPYYFSDYQETSYSTALLNDSVKKKVIYNTLPSLPVKELSTKSAERLKQNKNFIRLNEVNDSLKKIMNNEKPIALNPQSFQKEEKITYMLMNSMEEVMYDSTLLFVPENNKYDQRIINIDEYSKEINSTMLKNISKDIYIGEAYSIISDLITFGKH